MPFHFELRNDRPVLIIHIDGRLESSEIPAMVEELRGWLDRLEKQVYYIPNMGDARLSLGDIMQGVQLTAQGAAPPLHHPMVIETIVVTTDSMLMMASKSVNSYVFGNLKVKIFATLDEAIAYIDRRIDDSAV